MKRVEAADVLDGLYRLWPGNAATSNATQLQAALDDLLRAQQKAILHRRDALLQRATQLRLDQPDDSVMLGGDALHLSTAYREEQVSDWLRWVLEMRPLGRDTAAMALEMLLRRVLERREPKGPSSQITVSPTFTIEREVRVPVPTSNHGEVVIFDLVLALGTFTVIIENKIGDRSFDKNVLYANSLRSLDWPQPILLMLVPNRDLDDVSPAAQAAFPVLSWEDFIACLHSVRTEVPLLVPETERDAARVWGVITAAFLSFVETHILRFNLSAIRDVILHKEDSSSVSAIDALRRYIEFRGPI